MEAGLDYDEDLWFYHHGCEGKHFLIGNPHTVVGRMWAWCPANERSFFVSKADMGDMSEQARYWVKGFLAGNQPGPPVDKDGDVDFESDEYRVWQTRIDKFEQAGIWE